MAIKIPFSAIEKEVASKLTIDDDKTTFELYLRNGDIATVPFTFGLSYVDVPITTQNSAPYTFTGVLKPNQAPIAPKILKELTNTRHILVALPCGYGKTTLATYTSCALSSQLETTLIVTHSLLIKKQWLNTYKERTTIEAVDADDLIIGAPIVDRVVVCTVQSIEKLPSTYLQNIDLLIVDEAHCMRSPIFSKRLLECTPKYIIGLTATPYIFSTPKLQPVLVLLYGSTLITTRALKKFKVVRILTPYVPVVKNRRYTNKLDWSALVDSLTTHVARNVYICSLIEFLLKNPANKMMGFCERTEHITDILSPMLTNKNIVHDSLYGKKETYKCTRLLLGTYAKVGVGFDEEKCCEDYDGVPINIVLLLMDRKDIEQKVGRGFRAKFPMIFELADMFYLLNGDQPKCHPVIRDKYYTSKKATIVVVKQEDLLLE